MHVTRWLARPAVLAVVAAALAGASVSAQAQDTLPKVSYDVSLELCRDLNPVVAKDWQARGNPAPTLSQSHGRSSKQAGAVIAGLDADVVTMNQSPDVKILAQR